MEKYIEEVIAPRLQADGGWIECDSFEEGILKVSLRGECSKCHIADRCMDWIVQMVKRDLGQTITIQATRKKPFFWDN